MQQIKQDQIGCLAKSGLDQDTAQIFRSSDPCIEDIGNGNQNESPKNNFQQVCLTSLDLILKYGGSQQPSKNGHLLFNVLKSPARTVTPIASRCSRSACTYLRLVLKRSRTSPKVIFPFWWISC